MATRPNRSAGATKQVNLNNLPKIDVEYKELEDSSNYYFKVTELVEGAKSWYFAMPPAVEAALQYSPNAPVKGQFGVPEVKPGLLNNTTLKFKNFIVPGGLPVVQGIGVQSSTFQLVGVIIGSDGFSSNPSLNPIYKMDNTNGYTDTKNAARAAIEFDEQIAQKMNVVSVEIRTDVTYKFKGVILNFKYYQRRANSTYYVIDFLATEYGKRNA